MAWSPDKPAGSIFQGAETSKDKYEIGIVDAPAAPSTVLVHIGSKARVPGRPFRMEGPTDLASLSFLKTHVRSAPTERRCYLLDPDSDDAPQACGSTGIPKRNYVDVALSTRR